jgi:hypothetical protein
LERDVDDRGPTVRQKKTSLPSLPAGPEPALRLDVFSAMKRRRPCHDNPGIYESAGKSML